MKVNVLSNYDSYPFLTNTLRKGLPVIDLPDHLSDEYVEIWGKLERFQERLEIELNSHRGR